MIVIVHDDDGRQVIEAPEGARVITIESGDALVYLHEGGEQVVIVPLAAALAREGLLGLTLITEEGGRMPPV